MKEVNFTVDAGIINRLGKELVGRVETAVSELVKNAYDADANNVELNFIDSDIKGGTLIIEDDGTGMNESELINGFMRLSSTDKIHNPVSEIFKRVRAGKKGIGRFATQRLGEKLTIITQKENLENAVKVEIDWNKYSIDKELSSIYNVISEIPKTKIQGTKLIIEKLNDTWTESQIKRVFRYVSELLQPDFLSDRSKELTIDKNSDTLKIASQKEGSFKVRINKTTNGKQIPIADEDKMLFDKAVAVFEGYIDKKHDGFCSVRSERFNIDDIISIESESENNKYDLLFDIHFKAYYFIHDRPEYYSGISKTELKRVEEWLKLNSGIKLYRNGFRVLPYGEKFDDWLKIDTKVSLGSGKKGVTNVPIRNLNFSGFVEVIDIEGKNFEETASREGLQENDALLQLKDFVYKSLVSCARRVAEDIAIVLENKRKAKNSEKKDIQETLQDIENSVNTYIKETTQISNIQKEEDKEKLEQRNNEFIEIFKINVEHLKIEIEEKIEKIGMYRVLASLGLTVEMFTHEVQTYNAVFNALIFSLNRQNLDEQGKEIAKELKEKFNIFKSYTAYFNAIASKNESRKIEPIDLQKQINTFIKTIEYDRIRALINPIETEFYDLSEFITCPMHPAEWQSILLNLYTNSKKAIKRQNKIENQIGRIKIIVGYENNKIYLEFLDNGDGIAEEHKNRIFNAFFTTSTPANFDADENTEMTGTGLGLRIVADIIESYNGEIFLAEPISDFKTCFRIEIPQVTKKQIKEYGLD